MVFQFQHNERLRENRTESSFEKFLYVCQNNNKFSSKNLEKRKGSHFEFFL